MERNLQIHASPLKDKVWLVEIYNPNIGVVEKEIQKNFDTAGETYIWAETFGSIDKVFYDNQSILVSVPTENRGLMEKMLAL